jgi:aryl-alcohol dehydrogenase-like predicted oxidoreductase
MTTLSENQMRLGGSELIVSRLGIGAMTWGDLSLSPRFNPARIAYGHAANKEELRKAIDFSLTNGVNVIDTAAMYGKGASELLVGELTEGKEITIATKFPSSFFPKSTDFPKDLENSLKRLKRVSIDLYQIHYPSPMFSIPKVINQMADALQEGKIKAVGVSNFSARQLREAYDQLAKRSVPLASNQVEYSLLHREPEKNGVLETCRELNIALIAYMPLRMGALTGKYMGNIRPEGLRKYMSPFRKKDLAKLSQIITLLQEIGNRYSKSPSQVALRWLIQQGNILPIPGAKNSEQAIHNAGALTFSLLDSEIESLSQVTL